MNRICNKCKEEKDIELFHINKYGKYGKHSICKKCCSDRKKEFRIDNPEIIKSYYRKHYDKYKDSIKIKTTEYHRKNPHIHKKSILNFKCKTYGITKEQYENIIDSNNGNCHICNLKPKERCLFIDHSHKTNIVRGVLCSKCNSAIGFFNDDINLLNSAIKYLTKEKNHVCMA